VPLNNGYERVSLLHVEFNGDVPRQDIDQYQKPMAPKQRMIRCSVHCKSGGGMVEDSSLSVEDVIDTLTTVLLERYGDKARSVAERQAAIAGGLPQETWQAIIARLQPAT
jgi:hypothetical protein